jgi:hypothetical protein
MSLPTFALVTPDGQRFDNGGEGYTRQAVLDCLPWLPAGTRVDPPLPPGNGMALTLLDHLCGDGNR